MKNNIRTLLSIFFAAWLMKAIPALAFVLPNVETVFNKTQEGFMRAKVVNKTRRELACYLAIDGYKIKFRLLPFQESRWYKATDIRFNAQSFSTWCDYIENQPEYRKYKIQL